MASLDFSALKQNINLIQYASHMGYTIDKRKSTRASVAMQKENCDKIIISKSNGIWVYFSVYDDKDNGTILDFVKNRADKSIYTIGRELEAWSGLGLDQSIQIVANVKEKEFEPERIQRLFNYYAMAFNNAYLYGRGITTYILRSKRFVNRVFQDQFKNAVFPHFKERKVCGLELKGFETDLFVRGSEKTLWRSNRLNGDNKLIITENPIDAMSYQNIHQPQDGFYTATCGGFSRKQGEILQHLVLDAKWIKSIIIAVDNDQGGDQLEARLQSLINKVSYSGEIRRHSPFQRGYDWNDVLNQRYI